MPQLNNLTGQRFGKLTVIRRTGAAKCGNAVWLVRCDCGIETEVPSNNLRSGTTTSCGCRRGKFTHGKCYSAEYVIWTRMIQRCENPHHKHYHRYGGRGIRVCKRWRNSFQSFYDDIGPRPSPKHSIDRVDNDGDYELSNCRWATRTEQQRNMRSNHLLTAFGETHSLAGWAEKHGLKYATIWSRINVYGWSAEKAITTPAGIWRR